MAWQDRPYYRDRSDATGSPLHWLFYGSFHLFTFAGHADEIVMTPLGGLAMAMAPRRPWAQFVTVAGGPAVNVVICLLCGIGLYFTIGIFPLGPWTFGSIYGGLRAEGWVSVVPYL